MDERILLVDDEAPLLTVMERTLGQDLPVFSARSGKQALEVIRQHGPFALVVSDMRMPEMSGLDLLQRVRAISPDTVRLMCSGDGDLQTAVKAVNDGEVFRFITKPFTSNGFRSTIHDSLVQYRLITAERTLLERTLNGLTQVLTDVLSLVNPLAGECGARVRPCATHIARMVAPAMIWQVDLAAMLSQLGCVTIAPELLQYAYSGEWIEPDDAERMAMHPKVAYDFIARIPRLEVVAAIILGQRTQRHSSPEETVPRNRRDPAILGGQILRIALEFDRLTARGEHRDAAYGSLARQPEEFDPDLVCALQSFRPSPDVVEVKRVALNQLDAGMVLEEDLLTRYGVLVMPKACTITSPMLHRLKDGQRAGNLPDDVLVRAVRSRLSREPVRD